MIEQIKEDWVNYIHHLQDRLCQAFEAEDGSVTFEEDQWTRTEGGGGKTRIISEGDVFEKGGINTSIVYGKVTQKMKSQLGIDGYEWFACGISLVLHPYNPFVPTVHANFRMFELYDQEHKVMDRWFGGGADLTPYYLNEEDAKHFHHVWKNTCNDFGQSLYEDYKKQCDDYFVNWHRQNERRGIGGIFYDHNRYLKNPKIDWLAFNKACGDSFLESYLPIVKNRKNKAFNKEHKKWQHIRRGRYVEFNLIHDRGTLFGLKTNGRVESILMSLPPVVHFDYNFAPGPEEKQLLEVCLTPRAWV